MCAHFPGESVERRRFFAEPFVVEEEVVLMLLLRVEGVAGIEGSSVWNSGANSGPTLAPRELALVVTILTKCEKYSRDVCERRVCCF